MCEVVLDHTLLAVEDRPGPQVVLGHPEAVLIARAFRLGGLIPSTSAGPGRAVPVDKSVRAAVRFSETASQEQLGGSSSLATSKLMENVACDRHASASSRRRDAGALPSTLMHDHATCIHAEVRLFLSSAPFSRQAASTDREARKMTLSTIASFSTRPVVALVRHEIPAVYACVFDAVLIDLNVMRFLEIERPFTGAVFVGVTKTPAVGATTPGTRQIFPSSTISLSVRLTFAKPWLDEFDVGCDHNWIPSAAPLTRLCDRATLFVGVRATPVTLNPRR